jgi:hypothetical protein
MGNEVKHPDPVLHKLISFAKSGIRIVSSVAALIVLSSSVSLSILFLAAGYGLAELVGIVEEMV